MITLFLIKIQLCSRFWGWGGEDDELFSRLNHKNLSVLKLSRDLGRFKVSINDIAFDKTKLKGNIF